MCVEDWSVRLYASRARDKRWQSRRVAGLTQATRKVSPVRGVSTGLQVLGRFHLVKPSHVSSRDAVSRHADRHWGCLGACAVTRCERAHVHDDTPPSTEAGLRGEMIAFIDEHSDAKHACTRGAFGLCAGDVKMSRSKSRGVSWTCVLWCAM